MLAGIVITVLVIAGLAVVLPWLIAQRNLPDVVDGDPTERFSDSMRILRSDVIDYIESVDAAEVSTPLTRSAELTELRLLSASAAKRRAVTGLVLVLLLLGTVVSAGFGVLPWWSVAIPGALLIGFLVLARIGVRAMYRRFDARAAAVTEGYGEEYTTVIQLQTEESIEISVDLAAPSQSGALWDPIPVTAPTYVSKPLVPRTVRTIDLSAPVVAATPVVPTADRPDQDVAEVALTETQENIQPLRPRAVGE